MKINPFGSIKRTLPQLIATDQIAELLRFSRTVSISAAASRNAIADPPALISGTASAGAGFPLCLCFLFFLNLLSGVCLGAFLSFARSGFTLPSDFQQLFLSQTDSSFLIEKKSALSFLLLSLASTALVDIAKLIITTRMGIFFIGCTLWLKQV